MTFIASSLLPGRMRCRIRTPGAEDTAFIKKDIYRVGAYFLYRGARCCRIVSRRAVPLRGGAVPVFEIGGMHTRTSPESWRSVSTISFIARAVPDDGDAERESGERFGDGRGVMRAGDEVNTRYALIAQAQHYLTQARDADALAALAAALFPVLAEHAAEIAAGKEYRPGAAAATYAWFSPKCAAALAMRGRRGLRHTPQAHRCEQRRICGDIDHMTVP